MVGIAERTRFSSASGGVIFGIEIQNYCSPFKVCQVYLTVFHYIVTAYCRKSKIWSRLLLFYRIAHKNLLYTFKLRRQVCVLNDKGKVRNRQYIHVLCFHEWKHAVRENYSFGNSSGTWQLATSSGSDLCGVLWRVQSVGCTRHSTPQACEAPQCRGIKPG